MEKTSIIEQDKRLSQSQIWAAQRAFYHNKGAKAWETEVPFYITSNPFIARCYATLAIRFVQDWLKSHPESAAHPFYILELGAGTGQFSYYVLQRLRELQSQFGLSHVHLCYIMSDFTEKNIKFWHTQRELQSYLQENRLHFSIYDLEKDKTITLQNNGKVLSRDAFKNPLLVFANYIFDTVKNDVFSIKDKVIKESLVTLKSTHPKEMKNKSVQWKRIKIKFKEKNMPMNYYEEPLFNSLLDQYRETLKDTHLLFPIGSLHSIKQLNHLSNNRLFLISSDKGFTNLTELDELSPPQIDIHGSFSFMVNYHAIGDYLKKFEGDAFVQSARDSISTVVYSSGIKFKDLPETQHHLHSVVDGFSPADYFALYEHITQTAQKATLPALLSLLRLSEWDPFIFQEIHSTLIQKLKTADEQILLYIPTVASRIAEHYYPVPGGEDIFFSLGLLLYEANQHETALEYYQQSEEKFGKSFETAYNIGLCYLYQDNYKQATLYFKTALRKNPKDKGLLALMNKTTKKMRARA